MRFVCVFSTAPDLKSARKLADLLLKKKLAACISLVPRIESHYSWKGKQEKSREIQLVIKTRAALFKQIEALFAENHPYAVPELIAMPITAASKKYSAWIKSSVLKD